MEKNENTRDEEILSAMIDGELSEADTEKIKLTLENSDHLRSFEKDLMLSRSAFGEMKRNTSDAVDFDLFWKDLSESCVEITRAKNNNELTPDELRKLLGKSGLSWFDRLFAVFAPAAAGVAAAMASVFFLMPARVLKERVIIEKPMARAGETVKTDLKVVSGDKKDPNEVRPVHLSPNPVIENIIESGESCVIESMQSAEDIITAVFKVEDSDGSMITVIWLPIDEPSEDTI
ncbi:MAG: hypothetical protein JXR95_01985 [Deltaproteobacteria bacterium]|nr:hypothetical protein [Deltaproteobacteria bacterium]